MSRTWVFPLLILSAPALPLSSQDDAWAKAAAFGKKLAAANREDPKAWMRLAQAAESAGLPVEAEHCAESAIRLDPDHAEARKKLGHVKKGGAWRTRVEQIRAREEKGSVLFGLEWVKESQIADRLKREQAEIGWAFERKIQGERWTIYTDAPEETGLKVLAVAEAVTRAFVAENAGLLPMAPPKSLRAYDFKDRARFMKEANLPADWAEGYYDGGRRACFAYYDPTNARNPFHWFVHEATHQLFAELVVNCSGLNAWLSEGYACWFGTSRIRDGELRLGEVDPDTYPAWWRKRYPPSKFWPLREFMDRVAPKFGELSDPNPFYLQAWLAVHYFMSGERRAAFRQFVADAARGKAESSDLERRVGGLDGHQDAFTKHAEAAR
jgi:hypothetical protein